MSLSTIRSAIKSSLTQVTGVSNWEAIQFSLLPQDSPIGYIQLVSIDTTFNQSYQTANYLVVIAVANPTLEGILTAVEDLCESLTSAYTKPVETCENSLAQLKLDSRIEVATIDGYVTSNVTTGTSGFRTSIGFRLKADYYRS